MTLERQGVPTATVLTDAFSKYAQGLCRMQGMADLPTVVIPHPVAARPEQELRAKVQKVYTDLKRALTREHD